MDERGMVDGQRLVPSSTEVKQMMVTSHFCIALGWITGSVSNLEFQWGCLQDKLIFFLFGDIFFGKNPIFLEVPIFFKIDLPPS